ncbi:MAG: VWA domain-containing protein [Bryobacterales bacterium]
MTIGWTGAAGERDFISIVPPDLPEGRYAKYAYTSSGNPVKLLAPDKPGAYEIRWLSGEKGYPTRATVALTVLPVQATLDVPAQADAGQTIEVSWNGPNNPRDFITIVPKGTPERKYAKYVYANTGNPVKLPAPDEAGEYEIRYLTGQDYLTLAAAPVLVGAVSASLEANTNPAAGESLSIRWEGPNNPRDFITVVPAGTPERKYAKYSYTDRGNPAVLEAPDEPGEYEIRYLTGQEYRTLASLKITVGATSATVDGPESVKAGRVPFEVTWTGPDNRADFITIIKRNEQDRKYGNYAYTRNGSPLQLLSPLEPGDYELRYLTGRDYKTLAAKPITVTPGEGAPGRLRVTSIVQGGAVPAGSGGGAVEIILDASGSMLQRQGSERRIEIAKRTLIALTQETIPPGTTFALRVFGHKEADSCRTDLEMTAGPLDPAAAALKIGSIQAMNLAKTPIAASLAAVLQDLRGHAGEKIVVLVTDGEETCEGDPAETIEALREAGVDVRVNIVGFAIDDEGLKSQFRYWAEVGGGGYFDAADADQLGASLTQAVQAPYEVYDDQGRIVANGVVGGAEVEVPSGVYVVRARTQPAKTKAGVEVKAGETTLVPLD